MFQTCPAKFDLRILNEWTGRRKSAALGFGGALHQGLKVWYRGGGRAAAITSIAEVWPQGLPTDDWRTKEKCMSVMLEYMKEYPVETFKILGAPESPMVEQTFTLPTGKYLDCIICGGQSDPDNPGFCSAPHPLEEIEYGGIFDGGVEFTNNFVFEHKTTTMMGKPPHSWFFQQFKPNNQVTGYIWALGQLTGQRVGGAIINAIGLYKSSATRFAREITTRSDEDIESWLDNVRATCQMIKDCERRGHWPKHTGSCTMYGKCEFHDVHVLGAVKEQEKFLEQQYIKQPWDYEHRDEGEETVSE